MPPDGFAVYHLQSALPVPESEKDVVCCCWYVVMFKYSRQIPPLLLSAYLLLHSSSISAHTKHFLSHAAYSALSLPP